MITGQLSAHLSVRPYEIDGKLFIDITPYEGETMTFTREQAKALANKLVFIDNYEYPKRGE
jgi:hypothetical protein